MKSPVNLAISDLVSQEDLVNKMINTSLSHNNFVQPVQVVDVNTENLTVDVIPLVNKRTVLDELVESNVIYNVKYVRIQSGGSAIIIDPSVGDIGIVVVCDKDISTVKETKTFAFPASNRLHSLSDSIYLGGILNQAPSQYVRFTGDGIEIFSPVAIKVEAPKINTVSDTLEAWVEFTADIVANKINLTANEKIDIGAPNISLNGSITANPLNGKGTAILNVPLNSTQDITAKGISLVKHPHGGVQAGNDDTGGPK